MTTKNPKTEKRVRLVWGSDDLSSLYANHFLVSHAGGTEFHLVFGHLTPPFIIPKSMDEFPDELTIEPAAKIVLSPDNMRRFVEVMVDNLEKFERKQKEENDGDNT